MNKPEDYKNCSDCTQRTKNTNDGGPILCYFHDAIFKGNLEGRKIPVIVLTKNDISDVTHFALDGSDGGSKYQLETLISSAIEEWSRDQSEDPDDYAFKLGAELQWLTKKELEEVPEA